MSPEALIYLIIWLIAIGVVAYVAVIFLTKAGAPDLAIKAVWLIAFLLVLLVLLRHTGVLHVGALEPGDLRSLLA